MYDLMKYDNVNVFIYVSIEFNKKRKKKHTEKWYVCLCGFVWYYFVYGEKDKIN